MLIPYNVDVPMQRWPIANWVLIAATTIATFWLWGTDDAILNAACRPGEEFSPLQLITHTFVHADFFHLVGNMLFLFVFGNAVNAKLGHPFFLVLYFVAGSIGALAWLAAGQDGALIGASGAIMGIVGAFLVYYPRNDISVAYWFGFIAAGTFAVSSYWIIALYVAFDVWGMMSQDQEVAYLAHVGGAASGFAIAAMLVATGLTRPSETEQTIFQAIKGAPSRKTAPPPRRTAPGPSAMRPPPNPRPVDDEPIPLVGDEPVQPRPIPRPVGKPMPPRKPSA